MFEHCIVCTESPLDVGYREANDVQFEIYSLSAGRGIISVTLSLG